MIKQHYLVPPSSEPYHLKGINNDRLMPSQGQAQAIVDVYGGMVSQRLSFEKLRTLLTPNVGRLKKCIASDLILSNLMKYFV